MVAKTLRSSFAGAQHKLFGEQHKSYTITDVELVTTWQCAHYVVQRTDTAQLCKVAHLCMFHHRPTEDAFTPPCESTIQCNKGSSPVAKEQQKRTTRETKYELLGLLYGCGSCGDGQISKQSHDSVRTQAMHLRVIASVCEHLPWL
eukprot:3184395-Amphidinium_carterae.1